MRKMKNRVGVRELRQNLSVYLRRVISGEALEVTERGRPVATLSPLSDAVTPLDRLVRSGRATAPAGDLCDLGLPPGRRASRSLTNALEAIRKERI